MQILQVSLVFVCDNIRIIRRIAVSELLVAVPVGQHEGETQQEDDNDLRVSVRVKIELVVL